jgi:HlyD family secretion protein
MALNPIAQRLLKLPRPILIGLAVVGSLLLLMGGCQLLKPKPKVDPYRFAAIERGDVTKTVSASGNVQALVTVQVGSQLSGLVSQVLVDFNSPVSKGDVLAVIDAKTYASRVNQGTADLGAVTAALAQQRAALEQAKAQNEVDQAAYRRVKSLADQGFASGQALDQATAAVKRSEAGVALARAQIAAQSARVEQSKAGLEASRYDLGRTQILSPIDGVVVDRKIDPGQTVAASFQAPVLFQIAQDLSKLQVKIMVDEADIGQIREGQTVKFTVDAYPDETFQGAVTQVRKQPETQQNVVAYAVIAEAENKGGRLLPGMTANADVVIDERPNVLKVPAAALRFKPADMQAPTVVGGPPGGGGGSGGPGASGRPHAAGGPGDRAGGSARFLEQLDLTADQKAKAKPIFEEMRAKMMTAGQDPKARRAARDEAFAKLTPLLKPEQRARLTAMQGQFGGRGGPQRGKTPGVVWILKDKKPWPVPVRVGASDGSFSEIEGDIKPGDQVIIGGGPKPLPTMRSPFGGGSTARPRT